jgi:hypothetical protein
MINAAGITQKKVLRTAMAFILSKMRPSEEVVNRRNPVFPLSMCSIYKNVPTASRNSSICPVQYGIGHIALEQQIVNNLPDPFCWQVTQETRRSGW